MSIARNLGPGSVPTEPGREMFRLMTALGPRDREQVEAKTVAFQELKQKKAAAEAAFLNISTVCKKPSSQADEVNKALNATGSTVRSGLR